ncbi:MAG: hypothetical protein CVT88_04870 [Candidatus Altiarchaeales archaeon HGW-Altiarchaeales-1]|nr:MAG: hypothetical protein CVT88_04870 [Candidatus Altiarchaeales archaeon HGW-Altiarchaeales-1]
MKCFDHPEVDAVMTCSSCGKGLCKDCVVQKGTKIYCSQCAAESQKGLDTTETIVIGGGSLCLSPIIAIVAWFIWRESKPEKAKQVGYICIAVIIIWIILFTLYFLFILAIIGPTHPYSYY